MRRLALHRFPHEIIRQRQGPGSTNFYGEFEPGTITETVFPALVTPLTLEDSNFVGGVSLIERLKMFIPRGIARHRGDGDTLTWNGEALTWNGAPLMWGGGDGTLVSDDTIPLVAAFADRESDTVVYASQTFVVEESQSWPRFVRAIALRET